MQAQGAPAHGGGGIYRGHGPLHSCRYRAVDARRGVTRGDGMGVMGSLSRSERHVGLLLAALLAALGLLMAVAARHGAMAVHGWMAFLAGLALVFVVAGSLHENEPDAERRRQFYDDPTRFGIAMTLIWAVVGMGVGVWLAALMYWPEATPLWPATSYGRLRPVHTSGVIFGFGGNALIATSFYVLQRTSRARLADAVSP